MFMTIERSKTGCTTSQKCHLDVILKLLSDVHFVCLFVCVGAAGGLLTPSLS